MISVIIIDREKAEADLMERQLRALTASRTNDRLNLDRYDDARLYMTSAGYGRPLQMAIIDLSVPGGVDAARAVRRACRTAQIMLLADRSFSPDRYVHPSIAADYLMLRPWNPQQARVRIGEMFNRYLEALPDGEIWIRGDQGQIRLPLENIMYFESMEGLIFVRTSDGVYRFRDTLTGLERRLGDSFFRCHRCYLVNRRKIRRVFLQSCKIQLSDGTILPLGKKYHQKIRFIIEGAKAEAAGAEERAVS